MTADRPKAGRERVDILLVARGLVATREKARALLIAGRVSSRGSRIDKPGTRVDCTVPLEVAEGPRWVGRGGHKLAGALESFGITVLGRDVLDVGASTGGFTQVLLEAGARRLIALDVGRGQLDWSLRRDARVSVLEGINARHLRPEDLPFAPSLAAVDVSFISLTLVLPPVARSLTLPGGDILALVKPQFEVGRGRVGRGGIVRESALHRDVLSRLVRFADEQGWAVRGVAASALRGARGNQEYFLHLRTSGPGLPAAAVQGAVERVVDPGDGRR